MSPRVQNHASIAVHGEEKFHPRQVFMDDVADDSGLDFGEGGGAGVGVRTRVAAGADGVPLEVVVAVAVDSGAAGGVLADG